MKRLINTLNASLFKTLSLYLRIFISLQLTFYPLNIAYAQTEPPNEQLINQPPQQQEYLKTAEEFNNKVESLREVIFGPEPSSSGLYKNHPLDTFSLLGQTVVHSIDKIYPKNKDDKTIDNKPIIFRKYIPLEQLTAEVSHNEQLNKNTPFINKSGVLPVHSETGSNFHGNALIVPNAQKVQDASSNNQHGFTLSYKDQALHSFPLQVKWITFVDSYLVFLEPTRVSDKRALISFIDLKYFTPSIGRAPLPIFSIPIPFTEEITKETLENPSILQANNKGLHIEDLHLPIEQLSVFSKMYQMVYNVIVSFLTPSSRNETIKLTEEIIRVYTDNINNLESKNTKASPSPHIKKSYDQLTELIQLQISSRQDIGSIKDPAGRFQQLKETEARLENPQTHVPSNEDILKQFSKTLNADVELQKSLEESHSNQIYERTQGHRLMFLLSHLSSNLRYAESLSSKKIQTALATIAGTVLPGESIENRVTAFHHKFRQTLMSKKGVASTAVLAGLGMMAHPETGVYLESLMSMGASITTELLELISSGFKKATASFQFPYLIDTQQIHKAYGINAYWNVTSGISHLAGFIILLYAADHITSNLIGHVRFLNSESSKTHDRHTQNKLMELLNKIPTVNAYTIRKVFNRSNAFDYLNKTQKQHVEAQKHDIQMRAGMPSVITLPDGSQHHISFYITTLWNTFANGFRDSKELSVQMKSTNGANIIVNFADLFSIKEYENLTTQDAIAHKDNTVTIEIKPSANESIKRVFGSYTGKLLIY